MEEKRVNKARIKELENGWIVNYDTFQHMGEGWNDKKYGTSEKAFTYDFKNEEEATWKKVVDFLTDWFYKYPGRTEF